MRTITGLLSIAPIENKGNGKGSVYRTDGTFRHLTPYTSVVSKR